MAFSVDSMEFGYSKHIKIHLKTLYSTTIIRYHNYKLQMELCRNHFLHFPFQLTSNHVWVVSFVRPASSEKFVVRSYSRKTQPHHAYFGIHYGVHGRHYVACIVSRIFPCFKKSIRQSCWFLYIHYVGRSTESRRDVCEMSGSATT